MLLKKRSTQILTTVAMTMAASAAGAQISTPWEQCYEESFYNGLIEGCTQVIKSGTATGRDLAIAYINRGKGHEGWNNYALALQDFDRAVSIDPDFVDARLRRGFAYQATGQLDQAMADFDYAIRLAPRDPSPYHARAALHWIKGNREDPDHNYELALKDYEQAIQLDPSDWHPFGGRSQLLHRMGRLEAAINDYDEVIRRRPKDNAALVTFLERRCAAKEALGRLEEALTDCTEAMQFAPFEGAARRLRGIIYLRMDRFDDALADFNGDLRTGLAYPETLFGRCLVKRAKGGLVGANADIATAIKLKPDVVDAMARHGFRP